MVLSVKCAACDWANGLSEMGAILFSAETLSAERGDRKKLFAAEWLGASRPASAGFAGSAFPWPSARLES
jgi:hypothetical protein